MAVACPRYYLVDVVGRLEGIWGDVSQRGGQRTPVGRGLETVPPQAAKCALVEKREPLAIVEPGVEAQVGMGKLLFGHAELTAHAEVCDQGFVTVLQRNPQILAAALDAEAFAARQSLAEVATSG